jgi:prolyl oligopeptidase
MFRPHAMTFLVVAACLSAGASQSSKEPPDPYMWLEEIDSPKSLEWVQARTDATRAWLKAHAAVYESVLTTLAPVVPNKTPAPANFVFQGQYVDVSPRPPFSPRGVWGRFTLDGFINRSGPPPILLDVDALGRSEGVPWVLDGAECLPPAYIRCLVRLSRGGSAAVEMREFDVETRRFVENGFVLPEEHIQAVWADENTIYVAITSRRNRGWVPGQSGSRREIRVWRRGTTFEKAPVLLAGDPKDDQALLVDTGGHHFAVRAVSQYDHRYFLIRGTDLVPFALPTDVETVRVVGGQLVLLLRDAWKAGARTYPQGSVIAIDFKEFQGGARSFAVVVPADEHTVVERIEGAGDLLLVHVLRNIRSELHEHQFKEGRWESRRLPAPEGGTIRIVSASADSALYAYTHESFLEPRTLYVRKPAGDIVQAGSGSVLFDPARYLVEQLWATSKDRTRVPYFVVRSRDMKFDGSTPVMMLGYGANGESQLPTYLSATGVHWLGRGGAYVLANIRGGGEFGPAWHAAARREKRQNAYDDFQAVAEDMIRRRITSPSRLGIYGASGGGLLMGVSLTQRPDLFGAVVGLQPVLEVKRCTGYGPVAERGDPTDPRDWDFIRKWTPYDNLSRTAKYPPVLLHTNRRDDVVHPCHARKFAARMEEMGHRVMLYETETGGHPGADTTQASQEAFVRRLTFFLVHLHPEYSKARR